MYNVSETPEYNAGAEHGAKIAKHIAPKLKAIDLAILRVYVNIAYNVRRAKQYVRGFKSGAAQPGA